MHKFTQDTTEIFHYLQRHQKLVFRFTPGMRMKLKIENLIHFSTNVGRYSVPHINHTHLTSLYLCKEKTHVLTPPAKAPFSLFGHMYVHSLHTNLLSLSVFIFAHFIMCMLVSPFVSLVSVF